MHDCKVQNTQHINCNGSMFIALSVSGPISSQDSSKDPFQESGDEVVEVWPLMWLKVGFCVLFITLF